MKNWILLLVPISIFSWITPWFIMPLITLIWAIFTKGKLAYKSLTAFLIVYLYWMIYAGVLDLQNNEILSEKVAQLFSLQPAFLLLVITGLLGGITAGLAAWSGGLIHLTIYKTENN